MKKIEKIARECGLYDGDMDYFDTFCSVFSVDIEYVDNKRDLIKQIPCYIGDIDVLDNIIIAEVANRVTCIMGKYAHRNKWFGDIVSMVYEGFIVDGWYHNGDNLHNCPLNQYVTQILGYKLYGNMFFKTADLTIDIDSFLNDEYPSLDFSALSVNNLNIGELVKRYLSKYAE